MAWFIGSEGLQAELIQYIDEQEAQEKEVGEGVLFEQPSQALLLGASEAEWTHQRVGVSCRESALMNASSRLSLSA